jgi:hypothetical protein
MDLSDASIMQLEMLPNFSFSRDSWCQRQAAQSVLSFANELEGERK